MHLLSKNEEIILATVWRLQDQAYGVAINEAINRQIGLSWKFGSIYTPLGRLVKKGLLKSTEGDPTPQRGGRRKIYFELTDLGIHALRDMQSINESVWLDLPSLKI